MAEPAEETPIPPALPMPVRFLSADEARQFLGLKKLSALSYLHDQPDPPPSIPLSERRRIYALPDLIAWVERRKTSSKSE